MTQKPARRYTNPRMGARAAMQEQERQEEEVAAPEGTATPTSTPVSGPDSTCFPTEEQVEMLAQLKRDSAFPRYAMLWQSLDEKQRKPLLDEAREALVLCAPLVNGIADQRDAAIAAEHELSEQLDRRIAERDRYKRDYEIAVDHDISVADVERGKRQRAEGERDRARALLRGMARRASDLRRKKRVAEFMQGIDTSELPPWNPEELGRVSIEAFHEQNIATEEEPPTAPPSIFHGGPVPGFAELQRLRAELEAAREKLDREQGTIREQAAELASLREELAAAQAEVSRLHNVAHEAAQRAHDAREAASRSWPPGDVQWPAGEGYVRADGSLTLKGRAWLGAQW